MKNILVAADEFHPYSNANTICLDRILDAFVRNGFDVTVLCFAYDKALPLREERRGCHVRRMFVSFDWAEKILQNKILHSGNPIASKLFMYLSRLEYLYGRALKTLRLLRLYRSLRRDKSFDLLLSGLCPIASHRLAYSIARRSKIPWIMYNMDSYVFNCGSMRTVGRRKRTEQKWCGKAAAVVNTIGLSAHNAQNGYFPYRGLPQLEIPLPNLEIGDPIAPDPVHTDADKIVLRYMGSFHEDVRRPDTLMQFLNKLDAGAFSVEFYGGCCGYVQKKYATLPACLSLMGNTTVERCRELTRTADILINIGNDCTNQMPSKVFEYIASGKPILNFYTRGDEPGLQYLRRYPRILHLRNADDADADALRALPSTPEVTAEELRGIYKDVLSETVCDQVVRFAEKVVGT